jgi:selenocysteine lyase/cysteine desulfurase
MNRKLFLKNTLIAATGLLLPTKTAIAHPTLEENDWPQHFSLNKDIIYLNNATMGISPKLVIAGVLEGLEESYQKGLYGRRKVEAIDNLASFVGVQRTEIALTHNTTEGINMMVWGLTLKAGDEVILCTHEHAGNASPWLYRAQQQKLAIKAVPLGNTAQQTLDIIKKAIGAKTKVLAMPHIPCTNGQVLPIKEIAKLARSKNITTCIDGAHPIGMMPLNISELGVDFYAGCCHKWLCAAQGTGFLYINKNKVQQLKPVFYGADGILEFNTIAAQPYLKLKEANAHNWMYGTQSGALWQSVTAAIQWQNNLGRQNIYDHAVGLSNYLLNVLSEYPKAITILTPYEAASRAAIVSFRFTQKSSKQFFDLLASKNILIRYVAENNMDMLRVSTHIYNTTDHLDALLLEIKKYLD